MQIVATFDTEKVKNASEKVVLCHVEPKQYLKIFSLSSGAVYKRTVSYFVVGVADGTTAYTEASSASLNASEWYYNPATGELFVRTDDDADPREKNLVITYRFFFSNTAINLPFDLSSGDAVYYEGRVLSNSPITKALDEEQIGLALESNTSIRFINTDSYFDDIYDSLVWENKTVKLWTWFPNTPISEAKKLFDGVVQDMSFSSDSVSIRAKDFIFKLRDILSTENFTLADGTVPEKFRNKPKRTIYGRLKQLQCTPIDAVIEGYSIDGTVSFNNTTKTLTGTGTDFLDELSPEDTLIYNDGNRDYNLSIESIQSDTSLTLSSEPPVNGSNATVIVRPRRSYRRKNREFSIAGHKLREPQTTISNVISANRFEVADSSDFFAGDLVTVDGEEAFVRAVNDAQITLVANLQGGIPTLGDAVVKSPVTRIFVNGTQAFVNRDWTITNTTEAKITFNELAEFNLAPELDMQATLTFTNASRSIVYSGDLSTELRSRDWLKSDDVTHAVWYELLSVDYDQDADETTVLLRVPYAGSTTTGTPSKKQPDYISENSIVVVDCIGKETNGEWVKTASDAVKDILEQDLGFTNINTASFSQADDDAPYELSLAIPDQIGGKGIKVRDIVNRINQSVFGSLVIDNDFNFKYQVLNADRPTEINYIEDHDLIKSEVTVRSRNEIKKSIIADYRPFTDRILGGEAFEAYEFTSDRTTNLVGTSDVLELTLYLYQEDDAISMAQRYALFYGFSTSTVTVTSNMSLFKQLNDKMLLKLDRLYKRFGALDKRKLGIVNKVTTNGSETTLEINDLGNIFNRVAAISADDTNSFTSSDSDEKIIAAWICDNDTETPDSSDDDYLGSNIIG